MGAQLFGKEKEIYAKLSESAIHFDSLFELVGGELGEFTASLMGLQLSGLITVIAGDYYARSAMPQ